MTFSIRNREDKVRGWRLKGEIFWAPFVSGVELHGDHIQGIPGSNAGTAEEALPADHCWLAVAEKEKEAAHCWDQHWATYGGKSREKCWHQFPLSTNTFEQTHLLIKMAFKWQCFTPKQIKFARNKKYLGAAYLSFSDAGNQPENVLNDHPILLMVLLYGDSQDRLFQAGFQHLRLPDGPRKCKGK